MKKVTVKIDKKGNTTIETDGFTGGVCKDVIKAVTQAMGAQEIANTDKAELFQQVEAEQVKTSW